jgi:GTP cyclohydrolase I
VTSVVTTAAMMACRLQVPEPLAGDIGERLEGYCRIKGVAVVWATKAGGARSAPPRRLRSLGSRPISR